MRSLGALTVFGLAALASQVAPTQYLANLYSNAEALGEPLFAFKQWALYPPLAWWEWQDRWMDADPHPFAVAETTSQACIAVGFVAAMIIKKFGVPIETTGAYGTAKWCTEENLKKQGLLGQEGIVLCQTYDAQYIGGDASSFGAMEKGGKLIMHKGPQHAMMFAPTRSGKGVGVVVPTLLSWTGSVVCYDMKGENWAITSAWRSLFSHCIKFDPTARVTARFNPLMEIRSYPYDVRDAQNLGSILVNPDKSDERHDHWKTTGQAFLVAVILHVLYAREDKSIRGMLTLLTTSEDTFEDVLDEMIETNHFKTGPHPAVAGGASLMKMKAENERSGVLSTAVSFLESYRDPIIGENTAHSDFTIADLTCAKQPVSLFLVVPNSDFVRTRPVMRMIMDLINRRQMEDLHHVPTSSSVEKRRHRLLYLLDEFPSLGTLASFDLFLAACAGYKIKCLLIAQSLSQLDNAYGANNSIMDNCQVSLTFGAATPKSAKAISDSLGTASRIKIQKSESRKRGSLFVDSVSKSHQEYGRPLLTADEVRTFPFSDALLIVSGVDPYRAKKIAFFDDARFSGKAFNLETGEGPQGPTTAAELRAELPPRRNCHWLIARGKPGSAGWLEQPDRFGAAQDGQEVEESNHPLDCDTPLELDSQGGENDIMSNWDHLNEGEVGRIAS